MLTFPLEDAVAELGELRSRKPTGVATGGVATGGLVTGITTDSREVAPGSLFVALEGGNTDGHLHVGEALSRGAVGCVVREGRSLSGVSEDRLVETDDPLGALAALARFVRRRLTCQVIGITGSLGKTTTKELLATILGGGFETAKAPRSFNNNIGVPLTLFQAGDTTEILVAELGANHPGEIADLVRILVPTIGVVVSIAPVHLEGFGSLEGVIRAKAELAAGMPPDGRLYLNAAMPGVEVFQAQATCPVTLFGEGTSTEGALLATDGEGITCRVGDHGAFRVPGASRQHLPSVVAAITVALDLGMEAATIRETLGGFSMPGLRWQKEEGGGASFILDCYNASPESVDGALEAAGEQVPPGGRLVLVLGDMRELGAASPRYHRELGHRLSESRAASIVLYGEEVEATYEALSASGFQGHAALFHDRQEVVRHLERTVVAGDVVLFKGSREK